MFRWYFAGKLCRAKDETGRFSKGICRENSTESKKVIVKLKPSLPSAIGREQKVLLWYGRSQLKLVHTKY